MLAASVDAASDVWRWREAERTALARALVARPVLLLADEPTAHQDEVWGRVVLQELRRAAERGGTCLVATHNPEAMRAADRVVRIRDGVIDGADAQRE
jgi:putative ABC transport system ATP-binding protein